MNPGRRARPPEPWPVRRCRQSAAELPIPAQSPAGAAYLLGTEFGSGQLGNGNKTDSNVPVAVSTAAACWPARRSPPSRPASPTPARSPAATRTAGDLAPTAYSATAVPPTARHRSRSAGALAGKTVTAISAGRSNTCAVAEGRAYCWGYNANGQLGNGFTTDSAIPVAVNVAGRTGRQDRHRHLDRRGLRERRPARLPTRLPTAGARTRSAPLVTAPPTRQTDTGCGDRPRVPSVPGGHRHLRRRVQHLRGGRRQGRMLGAQRVRRAR